MNKKNLEVYIHIPFCKQKCAYCDFLSFPKYNQGYIQSLKREITQSVGAYRDEYIVSTIFIGGGTPSFIDAKDIAGVLEALYRNIDIDSNAEVTIEANPGTLNIDKLRAYRAAGINRLSIGLQSVNDDELKMLGRIHTYKEFLNNYNLARKTGFENINIDLISALPNQTVESYNNTLKTIVKLSPEHISAYSLIIEEGTRFFDMYSQHEELLPSEEAEREMYYNTKIILEMAGYKRYEISNYAKQGFECRHNIGYWNRTDYAGFGIGAASLINNVRFSNIRDIHEYIEKTNKSTDIYEEINKLTTNEQMEEFMFLGLRMLEGISIDKFESIFNCSFEIVYGDVLEKLSKDRLIIKDNERVFLSEKGIDLSNYVLSEFLI